MWKELEELVLVLRKRRRLGGSVRTPKEEEVAIGGGRRRCRIEGVGKDKARELVGRMSWSW